MKHATTAERALEELLRNPPPVASDEADPDEVGITEPVVTVSVVVPVYSGQEYLSTLVDEVDRLRGVWQQTRTPMRIAELILVDDAAIDNSPSLIDELACQNEWIVRLHLSRNYGQHSATVAGILYSSGDWIITMDEDLQHPPARIPDLLRHAVRNGVDVVYAQPITPVHGAPIRDWTSAGFKWLMRWLTDNAQARNINSFRLLRGDIARSGASVATHDTYFDVNLTWFTQRIAALPIELRDQRFIRTGKSGYRLKSLLSHAWRMLFSSHLKVLRLSTMAGFFTIIITLAVAVGILLVKLITPEAITVRGWPSLMVSLSLFCGTLIFMQGIALQYLSTLVLRAHGKPTYFVVDRSRDAALSRYFLEHPL